MKAKLILNNRTVEIELTTEQAKELGLIEEEPTGWERAEYGQITYYVDKECGVRTLLESRSDNDDDRFDAGNYFIDESLAERMAENVSLMLRMQRWADKNNIEPIDWYNHNQLKYYISYNYEENEFIINTTWENREPCQVYFYSEEIAQQAIRTFGSKIEEVWGMEI